MNTMEQECCKMALRKMMDGGHFSICTVDTILKMTGGVPDARDYSVLHSLHCVSFKEFTPTMRLEFPNLLRRVLESPTMELEIRFKPLARHDLLTVN